ncbi:MAG: ROK family glucokinase [Faecalibacterium sp.]
MKPYAFGIDLGGTTAKLGFFTTDGTLLEKWEVPTNKTNDGANILPNLAAAVRAKMAEREIGFDALAGVGIGVPGAVRENGYVPVCANLNGFGDCNVSEALSSLLDGIFVKTANDANIAALGEYWMGGAKEYQSVVLTTLGTGVGGGVIVNGKIMTGGHGAGGEIGHITVNRSERAICGCGKKGCLEQYSSATGVVRGMKRILAEFSDPSMLRDKDFAAKDVFDAARQGDALAQLSIDEMSAHLGHALSTIAETIDPEIFLLGGGVSKAGDILTEAVTKHFKKCVFSACRETPIKIATLGNDAGIYGAVKLILPE